MRPLFHMGILTTVTNNENLKKTVQFSIPSNDKLYVLLVMNICTRNTLQCNVNGMWNHPITSLYSYFTCCLY